MVNVIESNNDDLLRRIVASYELDKTPKIEDGAAFNALLWAYKEEKSRNFTTTLGLRNRLWKSKGCEPYLNDVCGLVERMQEAAKFMEKGEIPPPEIKDDFIKRGTAYLDKKIPVNKLLGERDRQPRDGYSWQAEAIMGAIAEKAFQSIKSAGSGRLDNSFPDSKQHHNLYSLLVALHENVLNNDLIEQFNLESTDSTKQVLDSLKSMIYSESDEHDDDFILGEILKTTSLWYAAHKKYLSELRVSL